MRAGRCRTLPADRRLPPGGFKAQAHELAIKTARLLAQGLAREGALRECYDDSGRGLWPVRGTFISWNVLALTLLREHCPDWIEPAAS